MKYYVYVYLNPLKPGKYEYKKFSFNYEPFYIGIGKKNRIDSHIKNARYNNKKTFKDNVILKILSNNIEPMRFKLYENITLETSKRLEKCLIKLIGRRDLGNGTLVNLTDGGDGCQNILVSKEIREKTSIRNKILWQNGVFDNRDITGEKNGFFNKHHTEETKEKLRNKVKDKYKGELNPNFNNKWTEKQKILASIRNKENHKHLTGDNNPAKRDEVRKKLSETKMGLKNPNSSLWEIISPNNEKIRIEGGIKRTLKDYGLTYQKMKYKIKDGIYYSKNGWKMYKIFV